MKKFVLDEQTMMELWVAHRSAKKKRDADRIKAIYLLADGYTAEEVAHVLMLDEDTLRAYKNAYQSGGISKLIKMNYKGSKAKLTAEQIAKLEEALSSKIYLTTQSIIAYVESEFGIVYSQSGMRDLLHRLGYVYKKPSVVPGDPDREAQEIFAEQYEAFMQEKPDDVEVLFADAVHPEHNGIAAYGWMKRGEARELKTNSGRQRLNLHGAMNAESYQVTVIESDTVNRDSTINLTQAVEQAYPDAREILMIVDNAPYHFAPEVKAYLATSRVRFVPLPSYSPNLNLIERLWKFFKKKVLYNQYYKNLKDFRKACIHFFRNIDNVKNEMISFVGRDFELA
jgi:transposase